MQESTISPRGERAGQVSQPSDLFLRYLSFQDSNYFNNDIRQAIGVQFNRLTKEYPEKAALFEKFIYDPGLNKECQVEEDDHWRKIINADPAFSERQKLGVKILRRNSIIQMAEHKIMQNENLAFIHFDIKDLRLADSVGYAEHLLRDFALVLHQVAAEENQLELVPARVGGDEFVIMASSDRTIQEHMLEAIYEKAKGLFKQKMGFYMVNETTGEIEKRQADLKEKKSKSEHFITANSEQAKRNFLVRALAYGNLPSKECLRQVANASVNDFRKAQANIKERRLRYFNMDREKIKEETENFFEYHPEFSGQGEAVSFLLERGEKELAASFYTLLKGYLFDPVVNWETYHLDDYIKHLQLVLKPDAKIKIVTLSLPWTKNFNSSGGLTKTDRVMQVLFNMACGLQNPFNLFVSSPSLARDGGDFTFISDKYYEGVMPLANHFPLKGRFKQLFKDHIPVMISSIEFTGDIGSINRFVINMKDMNRAQFIRWQNNLFYKDYNLATLYLEYLLTERKEERQRSMGYLALHPRWRDFQLHPKFKEMLGLKT